MPSSRKREQRLSFVLVQVLERDASSRVNVVAVAVARVVVIALYDDTFVSFP